MRLELEKIRRDGGTQPRSKIDSAVTEDYAELMRSGVEFPPITVFYDGNEYWLADGFHRVGAWLRVRPTEPIEAEVIQGTQSEAQWYSYGVNKSHGERRTREDRVRAIKAALCHPEGAQRSDSDIARHIGVSPSTVGKYRAEIEATFQSGKSSGHAGKSSGTVSQEPKNAASGPAPQPVESPAARSAASRPRKGRDGRTINTAKIGRSQHKPRSSAEFAAAKRDGYQGQHRSLIKLALPNNHVYNCAFDLLQHFAFEYLEKVFQEVINIHQQRSAKEVSP